MRRANVTRWIAGVAAALAMSAACKRQQPDEAGAARRVEPPGQPVTAPATPPAPPDAHPGLDESAVRALVERWRAAQNAGDFDAYAALYGDGFEGVKRAGEAVQRFDRAGWLADRERMFARPMRVDVDELRVDVSPDGQGARAELVQTWTSGSFGDRGRKRLDLALRGDELRIVREEMLDSRIVMTETLCLQALFPGYREATRRVGPEPDAARVESVQVVEPNPGKDQFVCLARTFEPNEDDTGGSGELTLALLARKGRRWRVVTRQEHAFTIEQPSEVESTSASAKLEVTEIGPAEDAIVFTLEEGEEGPMISNSKERVVLYRVRATGLEELLALESVESGGEGDSARRETFSIDTGSVHGGLYDIEVERVETSDDWHANEHSERRDTDRYRWDGSSYEEIGY